eukprot:gene12692-26733_t
MEQHEIQPSWVSIIIPFYNAASYLPGALNSIVAQTYRPLEVVLFNDGSSDNSTEIIKAWFSNEVLRSDFQLLLGSSPTNHGPGFARNEAILLSHGEILCHLDADDQMEPTRIFQQVNLYKLKGNNCIIGTNFIRSPIDSTPYYTDWLNAMTDSDLKLQQFRECTIICPTWLYSRELYNKVGKYRQSSRLLSKSNINNDNTIISNSTPDIDNYRAYVESSPDLLKSLGITRIPEDLFFFLDAIEIGATLAKVPYPLLSYTYSAGSWTMGSKKEDLAKIRTEYIERIILMPEWNSFSIWGNGRDGRKFMSYLSLECVSRVRVFIDVDLKKIGKSYYCERTKRHIPVIHFSQAIPPMVICVASKRAGGILEKNIATLDLTKFRRIVNVFHLGETHPMHKLNYISEHPSKVAFR